MDTEEPAKGRRRSSTLWGRADPLSVLAVFVACVLIYAAPVVALDKIGKPVAAKWKKKLEIVKEPTRTDFFHCAAEDSRHGSRAPDVAHRLQGQGRTPGSDDVQACRPLTAGERLSLDNAEILLMLRSDLHLKVVRKFFEWQYLATLAGLVSATLTAAALLLISLQGLPTSAMWSKALFVVASVLSSMQS